MKCPIRKIHDRYGKEVGDHTCDKECAWFVEGCGCALLQMAKNLGYIAANGLRT
ncbi:hypothetical protein LCGC14_2501850 [marine sediment metagenome]|uniref:Uncharacterized protein n=1 Tax=marine sediment metagenome TaxID=412755 RepID=A0A0F9DVC4_9ZZZZ